MNEHTSSNPDPHPKDARKVTEDQREQQDQLEHQGDDPDAPGLPQSAGGIADESGRWGRHETHALMVWFAPFCWVRDADTRAHPALRICPAPAGLPRSDR